MNRRLKLTVAFHNSDSKGIKEYLDELENIVPAFVTSSLKNIKILSMYVNLEDVKLSLIATAINGISNMHEKIEKIEYLLHHGANPDIPDLFGNTAISYCEMFNYETLGEMLLSAGAKVGNGKYVNLNLKGTNDEKQIIKREWYLRNLLSID